MKKRNMTIIAVVVLVLLGIFYLSLIPQQKVFFSPLQLPTVTNCSNDDNITALWNSVYVNQIINVNEITIVKNNSNTSICTFHAYKQVSGITYVLAMFGKIGSYSQMIALHGKFTTGANNILIGITPKKVGTGEHLLEIIHILTEPELSAESRATNISSARDAKIEFESVFNFENSSAFIYYPPIEYYNFTKTIIGQTSETGIIFSGRYLNFFSSLNISECISNWVQHNTTCTSSEIFKSYYLDSNNCGTASGMPENQTNYCDYNWNRIIGGEDNINKTSFGQLDVEIGDADFSSSHNYTADGTEEVRILEDEKLIVIFEHDFSEKPLNFYEISLKKQSSSTNYGWLIVNGINAEKTVYVDRIKNSSETCVKDRIINLISSISNDCDENNEELINCPGEEGGIECEISGGRFKILGLEHSAVKEHTSGLCIPSWNCTGWGVCVGNIKTQICTDIHGCSSTLGKPNETASCMSTPSCAPRWNCTQWTPEKCSKEEKQVKVCVDLNNCGIPAGKPVEEQSCTYEEFPLTLVIVIFLVIIAMVAVGVIVIFLIKGKEETESPQIQYNRRAKLQYAQSNA